jgi:hypothetical protein
MTQKDTDIVPVLEKEVNPLNQQARALTIASPQELTEAASMLTTLNKSLDRLTAEKEKVTKPLNAALKAERARWKPLEFVLEDAIAVVRNKMSAYQTEAKRKADAEAEAIAARVGEGKGHLKAETAVRKIDELDKPQKEITTGADSSVHFRTVQKIIIIDRVAVIKWLVEHQDTDLLDINETLLKKLILSGQAVAGAAIDEVQEAANYR